MQLRVVSDDGDVLRLALLGRTVQNDVIPTSHAIEQYLGPKGYARLVLLSLAETHLIDSSGLSWLVVCHKRFCQAGGKLIVHSMTPAVKELLALMRLDHALNLADDEPAALASIGRNVV